MCSDGDGYAWYWLDVIRLLQNLAIVVVAVAAAAAMAMAMAMAVVMMIMAPYPSIPHQSWFIL